MKIIVTNNDNLREEDITEVVKRVKILLVNSNNEILLAYSHNQYQFPGGHVDEGEELIDTVNRELKEETGIELNIIDIEPFACSIGYWKDWPELNKNRKTEIYFYEVLTDIKPNLDNTNYTEHEINGGFRLEYIPLASFEEVISKNALENGDNHGIGREMLSLFEVYKSIKKTR